MAAAQAAMGVQTADHLGKAVYERACAACHNNPEATRSPSLDTLKGMRYQTISYALTQGKMQVQASALSAAGALGRDRLPGRPRSNARRLGRESNVPGEPRQDGPDARRRRVTASASTSRTIAISAPSRPACARRT